MRSPLLRDSLRGFSLGAFSLLAREVEAGAEIGFAFEEHESRGRPSLYEYRPLVRPFVEARAERLRALPDAAQALEELRREPAAAIFARAHAGPRPDEDEALFRTVLMPLAAGTAEACGGLDWDDVAFDREYAELERSLFGAERAYAAVAPLVGISVGSQVDLGGGLRVRAAVAGEVAAHWPEAANLLPPEFGREPDRLCVLELEQALPRTSREPPDAPGEIADAVTALRLATAAPLAAGPVLFERLDWRPFGLRPVPPIAATQPPGEPTRLDAFRGALAGRLRAKLESADEDRALGEALDRWELSLFQAEPFRSEQLRAALTALLGGEDGVFAAALRASTLLGETAQERSRYLESLRALAGRAGVGETAADAIRRALVETLNHGDRARLVDSLDESLLGLRPRPSPGLAEQAVAR